MPKRQKVAGVSVKTMVEGGIPLRDAVKAALGAKGETLASFGREIGKDRVAVSRLLGGDTVCYEEIRVALCKRLGFSRKWLDGELARVRG